MSRSRFLPSSDGEERVPLFIDTNVIVANHSPRSSKHDEVRHVMTEIGTNELPYYPLITNQYVLDEVASLLLSRADVNVAQEVVDRLLSSESLQVLDVEPSLVDRAIEQFQSYHDQSISITDHVIAVQAGDYEVEHIFSYDSGFRTLGFSVIPYS
ncbi:MAG: PIN domain-containing protein [Natrialbaceae archaeon]|nr:PIN domain-containing protein [Natrialbaceae archaeon]